MRLSLSLFCLNVKITLQFFFLLATESARQSARVSILTTPRISQLSTKLNLNLAILLVFDTNARYEFRLISISFVSRFYFNERRGKRYVLFSILF